MFDPSSKPLNTHLNFPRTFDDHPDSGVCSPPLWRTSPPKSPSHRHNNYQNLSPLSKAQVIARGQRELMEMVSKMPESSYELSMKDLVEVNTDEEKEQKVFDELPQRKHKANKAVRKTKSDKWVDPIRTGGANNSGLLLKMVFPVSFGAKKKTKKKDEDDSSSVTSKGSWISPRRSISDLSIKPEDKDWWTNELTESRGSQKGVSRINSGSSKSSGSSSRSNSDRSRSSQRDENSGCLSFLWNVNLRDSK